MELTLDRRKTKDTVTLLGLFLFILFIKVTVTLLTITVYAKFSPFPDAERYLNANLSSWNFSYLFNRTLFTDFIYASLKHILIYSVAVHLFISILLSWVLWFVIKDDYKYMDKPLLLCSLLLPHFLIWTGVVGKEALAIAGFLLVIRACVDLVIWGRWRIFILFIGLTLGVIERPHYALSYIYLYLISLLIAKTKVPMMSLFTPFKSSMILLVTISTLSIIFFLLHSVTFQALSSYMSSTQHYFLSFFSSTSNRWSIEWDSASNFFSNLPWGLPVSILGPTISEALIRPILLPVFVEGCFALLLLIAICSKLSSLVSKDSSYHSLIIWGFIPAIMIGLLINYPFGIFNPGSAIRYKQSLAPLIYFFPLILLGAIKTKQRI